MPSETITVATRVSPELKDRLDRAAKAERRTLSNLVNLVLEDWLDKNHPE